MSYTRYGEADVAAVLNTYVTLLSETKPFGMRDIADYYRRVILPKVAR